MIPPASSSFIIPMTHPASSSFMIPDAAKYLESVRSSLEIARYIIMVLSPCRCQGVKVNTDSTVPKRHMDTY
jgi:hypothetical protein